MGKYVDGKPLTAAELNETDDNATNAAGAVGNATTPAELALEVGQQLYGATTPAQLASVVAGNIINISEGDAKFIPVKSAFTAYTALNISASQIISFAISDLDVYAMYRAILVKITSINNIGFRGLFYCTFSSGHHIVDEIVKVGCSVSLSDDGIHLKNESNSVQTFIIAFT